MRLAIAAALFAALCFPVKAQQTGDFDFYVLSLSWSPSYCAAEGNRADATQCAGPRPYEFVVHGLWPQYERGYPEFCAARAPFIPQNIIDGMLDLMPSKKLVIHQWRKHGTCATKDSAAYFASIRDARGKIAIPRQFVNVDRWTTISPADVETAFISANPGMPENAIAVTCDSRHLREVRVCLTREFGFRSCPEIDRGSCRVKKVAMPPAR